MTEALNADGLIVGKTDTIFTFTGRTIRPLDPDPQDIVIEDIAHALANQCRFTGHTKSFYSVAEHCILASQCVPFEFRLEALLHDASEAYLSDIARPVKKAPGFSETYLHYEAQLERAIGKRFGIPGSMSDAVRAADEAMLKSEIQFLMPPSFADISDVPPEGTPVPVCMTPKQSEMTFLAYYEAYRP